MFCLYKPYWVLASGALSEGDSMLNLKCYERCEIEVENGVTKVVITDDGKNEMHFLPFLYQPISVSYDEEGIENIKKTARPF